ncbi:Crp/Fnr family transcriptional regulator [Pseudacidovorax sp. NFM-22]|uniref:Crp/Fnr family transcriptional regulator n=1 Tax=Pseudacidovorax sp. NFM-22 TaxID=2744469 RepID=UPI001F371926|nr:Crp/Fnr family transcriptional regulator [Pseudacidovorax sp. NFM-22]
MYIHPLLCSVPARVREALIRLIDLRHFRRNEVVLKAGDKVDALYCVGSGLLRVVVHGPAATTTTTNLLAPDDLHLSVPLDGAAHASTVSIVATLPSSVYTMPLDTLKRLCEAYPRVALTLMHIQGEQILSLRKQIRRRTTLSAEHLVGRVLQELTQLAPEGDHAFHRHISQGVIASYAGLSRQVVNRVLRTLEDRGAVQRDGDAVRVLDDQAFDTGFRRPEAL